LRNIDARRSPSAADVDLLSRRKRQASATLPAWMQMTGIVLATAALCSVAAGCADTGGAASKSDGTGQMRYYGGPKSPMWSDR
jgi:hypothetical protein